MKILIIGASGFLGTKLFNHFSKKHEVIGTYVNHREGSFVRLDATNFGDVRNFLIDHKPDVVIDTVALTSSVACEKNPELCKTLNYQTVENLVEICKEINAKMLFISSTYIFDGEKGDYKETDETKPLNEYGKTKVMAEKEVSDYENSIIVRVDIMYGYNGKNKPNGVFNMILSGNEIELSKLPQKRQPVLVEDVVNIISFLIEKNKKGIFHVAGKTKILMVDFLRELEKVVRNNTKISSIDKGHIVRIPINATLDISKVNKLGIKTCSLEEGLKILEEQYKEN